MVTGAKQQETGIWVSRHVNIHRSAILISPIYLGAHCRIGAGVTLGPNVSVGAHSVVDRHSVVRNSIVLPNTYIGQRLELVDSIADRRLLVNTRLSTAVSIQDRFLLNHLTSRRKHIFSSLI
jgi:NDP-sugar pyrophosphorylase family protein